MKTFRIKSYSKKTKKKSKMNILGIFILFLQTFAVPVFNKNEVMTRISRSAHQIKRNPCAKYLRRNHHNNRFGGYGVSVADNKSKYNLCMRMLVKKLRAKKLSGWKNTILKKPNLLPYCIKNCLLTAHVFTFYLH